MSIKSYRDLKVWQTGMTLTKSVYLLTRKFPKEELYGLTSQVRRSSSSIPANLAEGHARESTKEFLRHISIAQGSLAETETHLLLSESLEFVRYEQIAPLLSQCDEESKMLAALRRSLRAKLRSGRKSRP